MASDLLSFVIHYKKKIDKNLDDEEIALNVIRKLSKISITFEVLQATQIGKSIRKLSQRNDIVGEKAKSLLNKWKSIVNLESAKSSKQKSISNNSKVKECSSKPNLNEEQTVFHNESESSSTQKEKHKKKSSHHSSSKKSSDKHFNESNSSKSTHSLDEIKLKKLYLNGEDFEHSFNSPQTFSSEDKSVKEKNSSSNQSHAFSSLKRKLTTEEQLEECTGLFPKKLKSEKYLSNSGDKNAGTKSAKQSSSLHDKKVKSDVPKIKNAGFYPAESEISKPELNIQPSEEFTSQSASFEDCLGFNDIVTVKKKKSSKTQSSLKKTHDSVHLKSKSSDKKVTGHSSLSGVSVSKKSSHSSKEKQSGSTSKKSIVVVDNSKANTTFLSYQPSYKLSPIHTFCSSKKEDLTNEDVIKFTSSRKEKTAIYSGRKNNNKTVPTLAQYCYRVLIENIDFLGPMADTPYELLKPILEKCTANQLFSIEKYNPHLLDDTNELWEIHCKRDYKLLSPLEHETWRDVYLRGFDEREEKLKNITANISASMLKATPVRQLKLAFIDSDVKPPRDVLRRQAKHRLPGVSELIKPGFSPKTFAKKPATLSCPSTSNSDFVDDRKDTIKKNTESLPSELASKGSTKRLSPNIDVSSSNRDITNMSLVHKKPKPLAPLMAKSLKAVKQCLRR